MAQELFKSLALFSEARGKEASGISLRLPDAVKVYKSSRPPSKLFAEGGVKSLFEDSSKADPASPQIMIGHSRMVTNGDQHSIENNQPVISRGVVGIHNGIIVNVDELWGGYPELQRMAEVDSEVIFSLVGLHLERSGALSSAVQATYAEIEGTASIAAVFDSLDSLVLASNNGSLFVWTHPESKCLLFASERYILNQLFRAKDIGGRDEDIRQVAPGNGLWADSRLNVQWFELSGDLSSSVSEGAVGVRVAPVPICDLSVRQAGVAAPYRSVPMSAAGFAEIEKRFPYRDDLGLKRCTRCVLPETMPFIEFDADGVCNYCRNHTKQEVYGVDELRRALGGGGGGNGRPNCIVGVSGGRDSIYGLHFVKTRLKMNPVAFTYDWGMVTDLARRNISRICAKLGVEHALVSADITRKRKYIRQNVSAWLARPELGIIPLFMAGDKQYFYYLEQVKKHYDVDLSIMCENMLEKADFKAGFMGVPPAWVDPDHVYTLPVSHKTKMLKYYAGAYLRNPRYINSSLWDTIFAFGSYYLMKKTYHNLFRYIKWEESEVVDTIIDQYGWETSPDTDQTWRIGDGTSAFYNYIYYVVAGFTENDTFRSNQIREGIITREEALEHVKKENRPRFKEIKWYLDTIELRMPLKDVLARINNMPMLYS